MKWRYYAQRITTGEWLDRDLQLRDVSLTWTLSGPGEMTATVDSELARAVAHDGYLLLDEWSTAIYAELDNVIRWGGLVYGSTSADNGRRQITMTSFTGYPNGRIYEGVTINPPGHKRYWETDAFNIVRTLWDEVQHDPNGNIGMVVDDRMSGRTLGSPDPGPKPKRTDYKTKEKFDAALKDWETLPNEPYELAWWNSVDMGEEIENVMLEIGADYREKHEWASDAKEQVLHTLQLRYPTIGKRRENLRFVEGENIITTPAVERNGEKYANHIFAIGAGEDRHTLRRESQKRDLPRLRRDKVVGTKDIMNLKRLKAIAEEERVLAMDIVSITSVEISNHPNAPMGSWSLGDEIFIETFTGFEHVKRWVRIVGYTTNPDQGDKITLTVTSAFDPVSAPETPTPVEAPVSNPGVEPVPEGEPETPADPDPTPEPEPNPNGLTGDLRIATLNFGGRGSTDAKVADLEMIAQDADIIGIQEGGDRGEVFNKFTNTNPDWAAFTGNTGAKQSVGILYRKSLGTVKAREAYLAVGSRYLGPKGAGGSTAKDKYVMRVDIALAGTGRRITVLNTHMIPSMTRTKDYLGVNEWENRREHYKKHIAEITTQIDNRNTLVFVTGDFNAEPDHELLNPFWVRVNMDHDYNTFGGRRIDFVTHRPHNAINVLSTKKVATTSDHETPIVAYRIKSA